MAKLMQNTIIIVINTKVVRVVPDPDSKGGSRDRPSGLSMDRSKDLSLHSLPISILSFRVKHGMTK